MMVVYLILENYWYSLSLRQHRARLLLAIVGFSFDALLTHLHWIRFNSAVLFDVLGTAPLWLLLLWLWFSNTLACCYRWLQNRRFLAATIGALFGPVAYWTASQLGAVQIIRPYLFTLLSSFFWAVLFYTVFANERINRLLVYTSVK